MKPGARHIRYRWAAFALVALLLALLVSTTPGFTSTFSVERARAAAVRISIVLMWPRLHDVADACGSGWTRSCTPDGGHGYDIVVSTAAHVLDVDDLENEQHPGQRAQVTVLVTYPDGQEFAASRGAAIMLDRVRDYGEVRFHSEVPRPVLLVGDPSADGVGAHLVAIASPGDTAYGTYEGHLITSAAGPLVGLPAAWLSTVPVSPGASGGCVLDDSGRVVATILGHVSNKAGMQASVLAPLPPAVAEKGSSTP